MAIKRRQKKRENGKNKPQISSFALFKWYVVFPGGASRKEPTCWCRRCKRHGFVPRVVKILGRRKWQPTPVFSPEEYHRQRSPVGYSPWGRKKSDTTEVSEAWSLVHDLQPVSWAPLGLCSRRWRPANGLASFYVFFRCLYFWRRFLSN